MGVGHSPPLVITTLDSALARLEGAALALQLLASLTQPLLQARMPLLYSFVARGTTVLAEHTDPTFEGNFRAVGLNFLERCPTTNSKFTFPSSGHTFNFLVDQGFTFLIVADEA